MKEKKLRLLTSAKIENHTKIFASMCPDEILDHFDDYHTREYYTTLMLGDVSGFTELTEKYTRTGQGGPSKLTEILNSYIGAMVQEILSRKGDVLKFSGDAFIVMWKIHDDIVMQDVAVEAMQTACIIQKHFGTFDTDVGVVLKVKLAVASGKIFFTSIGDPETISHYIITGSPVWECKAAEGLCRGGDTVVAPSCWQWANPNDYVYETMPDGIHTLLLASTVMWDPDVDRYSRIEIDSEHDMNTLEDQNVTLFNSYTTDRVPEPEAAPVLLNLTGDTLDDYRRWQVDYSLRPKVNKVAKAHMKNALRCYMIRPIVHAVEMDEPIEYLTEMRQVVILFINIITNVSQKKLIRLVDTAYRIVCGIVDSMQGCVNKTSLFDKDLMFLCIFGLRGDKHELESQIGLRCASKIHAALSVRKNMGSIAIGVTTGMTYCGVVGHILRREYTVIGMAVNKAARLMCAYPNRVVCDRESFLRSRLEARHFILQEAKYLKGISNVGPIYEFVEKLVPEDQDSRENMYPILGREEELNTFRRMLLNVINFHKMKKEQPNAQLKHNALVIRGEPRSGKTRLLDEMIQYVPPTIPCNRISLIQSDYKSPYTLVCLILSIPLGFTASSTPQEREDKIVTNMGKIYFPHLLCSLNEVFNVNFDISNKYRELPDSEKREITEKLLGKLMSHTFSRQWVILIDDAEYCDNETASLLPIIMKTNLIFFVMAFGNKVSSEFSVPHEVSKKAEIMSISLIRSTITALNCAIQVIDLLGLDKWYHAGLACQILGVRAISAELEKVIQEKSSGNPGWIESYLVCLVQSGDLLKQEINKNQLRHLGLVCPPEEMICRLTSENRTSLHHTEPKTADAWPMYQSSYTESAINLTERKLSEVAASIEDVTLTPDIKICITSPTFSIEDSDIEIKMDVVILKMFDALSPLDQLLLKTAAVLGETFNRYMLTTLLESTTEREFALAIKRLYELKILACAMGDFKRNSGAMVHLRKFRNINTSSEIRCACTGIAITEACADLPKYASCGLIRFKISMFRDTMYRLLTENHKVEIHDKALKYLQQRTRRCEACGGGHFAKLLGVKYEEDQREKKSRDETMSYLLHLTDFPVEKQTVNSQIKNIAEEHIGCLAAFKPVKKSPTRTFSNLDFSECQCNSILVTTYTQVVDHCHSIGRKDKMLIAILEFVEVSLSSRNIPQARKLLHDGELILEQVRTMQLQLELQMKGLSEDEAITIPYLTGKIQTLHGRCCLESGQPKLAYDYLHAAIRSLGHKYPKSILANKFKAMLSLQYQKLMFRFLRSCTVGVANEYAADFSDQLANCLVQMFILFRTNRLWHHSHLAAIWGLNAALESNQDFFVLCTTYAHMIVVAHHFNHKSIITDLENHAIIVCCRKEDAVELQELKAVAELYNVIFRSRWRRGAIDNALSIGFTTMKICHTIHAMSIKLSLLPILTHILLLKCQYSDVVSMLNEMDTLANEDADKAGRTWYYALCVDLQLEFGLSVISFRKCEQYYQEAGSTIISFRNPHAEKQYFTNMWLWCVRNDDWEAAAVWGSKIPPIFFDYNADTTSDLLVALKKLEGLLILYVHRVDTKNAKANLLTHKEIRSLFKVIHTAVRPKSIAAPRFLLLRAYYKMIRNRTAAGMKLVQESQKLAFAQKNKMIHQWAIHCAKVSCFQVWNGAINPIQRDFWKEHCTLNSVLDWHEVDMNSCKVVPFSLPLPKYPH
ncbi:LOW QUALITY PROTEIN: adenylate cyclase type 10-like [Diprion similis]|uniref:LOW QUALITY PROTEIN: adenylate cyclase type 10-like n=1 Tax=Diprion similis TaxID=362088 RepID=UPI001EF85346|nr:LOW QUALITY PROTEIN: adenylate cyclase type 10-like [Diprion similis]